MSRHTGRISVNTEEDIVKPLKTLAVVLGITSGLVMAVAAAEEPASPAEAPAKSTPQPAQAAGKCLEAFVNPVTGYAFCVNPRGAPVDPPPRESLNRPCKPRAHDDDPFTVYEHWSGC